MLYKSIISLIVAFSAATSAAASATPLRRGNGGYPPPPAPPVPIGQCNTVDNALCCNTYTSTSNPEVSELTGLLDLILNPTAGVGLSCLPIVSNTWYNLFCPHNVHKELTHRLSTSTAVCCTNVVQSPCPNLCPVFGVR